MRNRVTLIGLTLLLASVVSGALIGCSSGGGGTTDPTPTPSPTPAPVVLSKTNWQTDFTYLGGSFRLQSLVNQSGGTLSGTTRDNDAELDVETSGTVTGSSVPISYTVNTVREQRLASMAKTTDYVATTYKANTTAFKYRITAYWKIEDSDDGFADNTVECYGELRINGAVRWHIDRSLADSTKRERGQTIDIKEDLNPTKSIELTSDSLNPTLYQLSAALTDADSSSGDDGLGSYAGTLNLEELAGKPERVLNAGAAQLHIRVERIP